MKKILLVAGALLATTAAVAQVAPAPRDGVQTRAEVIERVRTMFGRLDVNRDGALTADEMKGGRQMARGPMAGRAGDPAMRQRLFDRLDANRDNMISRDEFARAEAMRGGAPREGRMAGWAGKRGGGEHGDMLRRADANNDQRITLAEMQAAALQRFDRTDLNRDGRITQDERQQMRQQRRPMAAPGVAPTPVR